MASQSARPQRSEDGRMRRYAFRVIFFLPGGCTILYDRSRKFVFGNWIVSYGVLSMSSHMQEGVLFTVFGSGGIHSVSVAVVGGGRALVSYVTREGDSGCVYTKAGRRKLYRVETALRFVKDMGVDSCLVDLTAWTDSEQLPLLTE